MLDRLRYLRWLLQQWIPTQLLRFLISIADKEHWHTITLCDISGSSSRTGVGFRLRIRHILTTIEATDPAASKLILSHIRCIGGVSVDVYPYYFLGQLLTIDKRPFESTHWNSPSSKNADVAIAKSVLDGALLGELYMQFPESRGNLEEWESRWREIGEPFRDFEHRVADELA